MNLEAENIFSEQTKYTRYLFYFLLIYFAVFISLSLTRLWGFGFGLQDIGIYHQVVWNTAQGYWFESNMVDINNEHTSWLAYHFDPVPILFTTIFYKIFPFIQTLLAIHILLISITSIIIFKCCQKLGLNNGSAFFWSFIYLIHPFTVYHAMFSFQETSFSVPLLAIGYYAVISRRFLFLFLICCLLILTKEHHGITVFGFGLVWAVYNKSWKQGVFLCGLGIIASIVVLLIIMPHLSPYKQHFMLSNVASDGTFNRYSWLRLPFDQLLETAPKIIFNQRNLAFIFITILSFALLPLRAFYLLFPVAGDFLIIILANSSIPSSLNFYYSAPFVPAFAIASAHVTKNWQFSRPRLVKAAKIFSFTFTFIILGQPVFLAGSKLGFIIQNNMDWVIGPGYQEVIAKIPPDKILMTDEQSGANISNRKHIFIFSEKDLNKADYVLLRLSPFDYSPASRMQNYFAFNSASKIIKKNNWQIIYWKYPYALFGKGVKPATDVDREDFIREVKKQSNFYNKLYNDEKTRSN